MSLIKSLLAAFSFCLFVNGAFAQEAVPQGRASPRPEIRMGGGGSGGGGGIGNTIDISKTVYAGVGPADGLEWRGNVLYDRENREPILRRKFIGKMPEVDGVNLYSSRMGSVEGVEYAAGSGQRNEWIVCDGKSVDCVQLTPITRTNMKLLSVIGSMSRKGNRKSR